MLRRIMIAIRPSVPSVFAIGVAARLLAKDGELVLCHAVDPGDVEMGSFCFDIEQARASLHRSGDSVLHAALAHARQVGVGSVSAFLAEGATVDALLRAADERDVDVIVVEAQRRSDRGMEHHEHVIDAIARYAKVPVVVIHHPVAPVSPRTDEPAPESARVTEPAVPAGHVNNGRSSHQTR
jgi:nucleotide-binding universal stress UspA family protein